MKAVVGLILVIILAGGVAQAGGYVQDEFYKVYNPRDLRAAAAYLLGVDDLAVASAQVRNVLEQGYAGLDAQTYLSLGEKYFKSKKQVVDQQDKALAQVYYKRLFGVDQVEVRGIMEVDGEGNIVAGKARILKRNAQGVGREFKAIIVDKDGTLVLVPRSGKSVSVAKGSLYVGQQGGMLLQDAEFSRGTSQFKGTFTFLQDGRIDATQGEINGLKLENARGLVVADDGTVTGSASSFQQVRGVQKDNVLQFKDRVLFSYKPESGVLSVEGKGAAFSLRAKPVLLALDAQEKVLYGVLTGSMDVQKGQWLVLQPAARLDTLNGKGDVQASYEVSKPTDFFFGENLCAASKRSCIAQFGSLQVIAKDDNQIRIHTKAYTPADIVVPVIQDDSEVHLDYNGQGQVTFSSEPLAADAKGLSGISSRIIHDYVNPDNEDQVCTETYVGGKGSGSCMSKISYFASASAWDITARHRISLSLTGIGAYYGTGMPNDKMEELKTMKKGDRPIPTDCITYCRDIMEEVKKEIGEDLFSRDVGTTRSWPDALKIYGPLQKKGWTALYYNPDTKTPRDFPNQDNNPQVYQEMVENAKENKRLTAGRASGPFHIFTYDQYAETKKYGGIPIQEALTDYNPTTPQTSGFKEFYYNPNRPLPITAMNPDSVDRLEILKRVPFALGTSKWGYHAWAMSYGKVYESHYGSTFVDPNLFTMSDFKDEFPWLDGVIMVPPGAWDAAKREWDAEKRKAQPIAD